VLGGFILGFTIGIIIDQSHKPLGVSKVDGTYVQVLIGGVDGPVTAVVVDADAISQTDTDGADIISPVATELRAQDITLALARVQPSVLELWTRAGAIDALGPGRVFRTVREAVNAVTATSAEATS
jgi:SulP family sulfate permease